jgi:hypothetical protein
MSYSRKTSLLNAEYQLFQAVNTRISTIKFSGVLFYSKLYFHNYVHFICSEYQVIEPISSSLHCLYVLHHSLVRSKLEYTSIVRNSVAFIDAKTFEPFQQKFVSVCLRHFFPEVSYSYTYSVENLSLHAETIWMHFSSFRFVVASNIALLCWKILVCVSPRAMLETFPCSMFVSQLNILLLLGSPMRYE